MSRWQFAGMELAGQRCTDTVINDAGESYNRRYQRGDDKFSKFDGNRPQRNGWDRLTLKSDPTPVRVRQMSPQRSNCWRWKQNQTKPSEFDPKVRILPYNRGNPLLSGMLCKDFSQGDQC